MTPDAHRIQLATEVIRSAIDAVLAGRVPAPVAIAVAVAELLSSRDDSQPAERPGERQRRENDAWLGELLSLEQEGRGRSAIAILARKLARAAHDPAGAEAIGRRLRRIRARYRKNSGR